MPISKVGLFRALVLSTLLVLYLVFSLLEPVYVYTQWYVDVCSLARRYLWWTYLSCANDIA